jgi:starch phosphorylase
MNRGPFASDEITRMALGLNRLSRNLWWTWDHAAQEVFRELSERGWRNLYHNAVAVLHEVSDHELRIRLQDRAFAQQVQDVLRRFGEYMKCEDTWGHKNAPQFLSRPIAYFSAEFGFHETLPIAAGGLGVLAGDHAKSASDLGLGFVGISLFYREGYFMQSINPDGWQAEYYTLLDPRNLPMEPVLNGHGEPLICTVGVAASEVSFKAWRVNVGRVPVYLLDSNVPDNEPMFRDLTLHVYGGDSTTRIMQELLLGVGGVRLLRAMGITPSVYHLNEGHAAFLILELVREKMAEGLSFEAALEQTRNECVFTTHTPVEAGHDKFTRDIVELALYRFFREFRVPRETLFRLGRVNPDDEHAPFNMTALAVRGSRATNAVSELHAKVTRKMLLPLYPAKTEDEVPIGHVSNGVHILGWMKGPVRSFWTRKLGQGWEQNIHDPAFWQRMLDPQFVSDEELWALRYKLRRELIEFTRRRLLLQCERLSKSDFIAFDALLNPDALTIGFARRFAVYKRATLVFQKLDRLVELIKDKHRPVQFIFAGKAHPRDEPGKKIVQQIINLSKSPELKGKVVFIENYDIHVARQMVSGCDLWLNNPRRPLEASGTSGMKTPWNVALNLSILDGWWREAYDGTNGFAIGSDWHPENVEEQDQLDSENLYRVLADEVIPCFFQRAPNGVPRVWIQKVRRAMATVPPRFNTWRMAIEYTTRYYLGGDGMTLPVQNAAEAATDKQAAL